MIILVVILLIGHAACWFALEGLRSRVAILEQARVDEPIARVALEPAPSWQSSDEQPQQAWLRSGTQAAPVEDNTRRRQPEIALTPLLESVEWEKVIGGSWLNKLGVLVFVIGVGLLLHYSFANIGAAGKILSGLAIALAMIAGGITLERKRDYPAYYGRGLIGGGWAALYFTTYAAHGIESARVIASPTIATALLIAVASGMILHSLRYRSQVVTGLAYFVAFATLAITPMTTFALVASVPLAISVIIVAYRFEWDGIAVAGIVVTYSAYVFSTAGLASGPRQDQLVLAIYWLLFEAFDIISLSRQRGSEGAQSSIPIALFPLNASAFVGFSILRWKGAMPIYSMLGASALIFLADALLRAWIRPPSREEGRELALTADGRGYEGSLAVAALLAVAAILERFSGLHLDIALMLEAEMLIIAGVQLELLFPAVLGSLLMLLPLSRVALLDVFQPGAIMIADFSVWKWSLIATLAAGVLYIDRYLLKRYWGLLFGYAAAGLVALVIAIQVTSSYQGLAWLVLGTGLLEAGLAMRTSDLRFQGYGAVTLGLAAIMLTSLFGADVSWVALGPGAILMYALAIQASRSSAGLSDKERDVIARVAPLAGSALVATLLWRELPAVFVAVGWSLFAFALIWIGVQRNQRRFRFQSQAMAVLTFVRCLQVNFDGDLTFHGFRMSIVTSVLVIAVLYAISLINIRESTDHVSPEGEAEFDAAWADLHGSAISAGLAVLLLTALLYQKIEAAALTEAWALEGLALVIVGFMRRDRIARLSGLVLLGICLAKLFLYDLSNLETLQRIVSFIVLGLLLLGASLIYARFSERLRPFLMESGREAARGH
jgi:Predicted membrane protein (DUF2339)